MNLYSKINTEIEQKKENKAFRFLKSIDINDDNIINLSTNDYLGIAQDKNLISDFNQRYKNLELTASSSRLLSGNHKYYDKIEEKLSEYYQSESALFFNSGYHLNIGVLPSLTGKNDLILADKLVHASLIEAFKLSSSKVIRYKHLDYTQLEKLLKKHRSEFENIFIVSESVFSMDGDIVDLKKLVQLKKQYSAYLYLDEAHAVGAIGENGLGLAEQELLISDIDFLVGTMGKALASLGAYLICSKNVKSYLVNHCKSLIYTTALPPINVAWSLFMLEHIRALKAERKQLSLNVNYLKNKLKKSGINVLGDSHILAIIVGENKKCLDLAKYLSDNKVEVQAVRPPTVPKSTARIRISLNTNLSFKDLDKVSSLISAYEG